MIKQEYMNKISKLSDEVLVEELYLIVNNGCVKGCLECPHKFEDTSQCKLDAIIEIIRERSVI